MKKLLYTLSIIFAFLFVACTSNKKIEIETPKYPSWYLNPNYENQEYLYGIGEGKNLDEAIKSALISISSRLSLTITSNSNIYNKSYTDFREYITKESTQEIFSNTENLKFNNYNVIDSVKLGFNSFIVNVEVKKIDLIDSLTNEILLIDEILKRDEKELLTKEPLTKYFVYKSIFNQYYINSNKVQILKNLNKHFDEKSYFKTLNQVYEKMQKNKSLSTFYITNYTNNETILNKLKEEINKDFLILDKNKAQYEIIISSNINEKNSHGFYIVDNTISFEIFHKNSLIKTKNYTTKGASSNSFDDALNNSFEEIDLSGFIIKDNYDF